MDTAHLLNNTYYPSSDDCSSILIKDNSSTHTQAPIPHSLESEKYKQAGRNGKSKPRHTTNSNKSKKNAGKHSGNGTKQKKTSNKEKGQNDITRDNNGEDEFNKNKPNSTSINSHELRKTIINHLITLLSEYEHLRPGCFFAAESCDAFSSASDISYDIKCFSLVAISEEEANHLLSFLSDKLKTFLHENRGSVDALFYPSGFERAYLSPDFLPAKASNLFFLDEKKVFSIDISFLSNWINSREKNNIVRLVQQKKIILKGKEHIIPLMSLPGHVMLDTLFLKKGHDVIIEVMNEIEIKKLITDEQRKTMTKSFKTDEENAMLFKHVTDLILQTRKHLKIKPELRDLELIGDEVARIYEKLIDLFIEEKETIYDLLFNNVLNRQYKSCRDLVKIDQPGYLYTVMARDLESRTKKPNTDACVWLEDDFNLHEVTSYKTIGDCFYLSLASAIEHNKELKERFLKSADLLFQEFPDNYTIPDTITSDLVRKWIHTWVWKAQQGCNTDLLTDFIVSLGGQKVDTILKKKHIKDYKDDPLHYGWTHLIFPIALATGFNIIVLHPRGNVFENLIYNYKMAKENYPPLLKQLHQHMRDFLVAGIPSLEHSVFIYHTGGDHYKYAHPRSNRLRYSCQFTELFRLLNNREEYKLGFTLDNHANSMERSVLPVSSASIGSINTCSFDMAEEKTIEPPANSLSVAKSELNPIMPEPSPVSREEKMKKRQDGKAIPEPANNSVPVATSLSVAAMNDNHPQFQSKKKGQKKKKKKKLPPPLELPDIDSERMADNTLMEEYLRNLDVLEQELYRNEFLKNMKEGQVSLELNKLHQEIRESIKKLEAIIFTRIIKKEEGNHYIISLADINNLLMRSLMKVAIKKNDSMMMLIAGVALLDRSFYKNNGTKDIFDINACFSNVANQGDLKGIEILWWLATNFGHISSLVLAINKATLYHPDNELSKGHLFSLKFKGMHDKLVNINEAFNDGSRINQFIKDVNTVNPRSNPSRGRGFDHTILVDRGFNHNLWESLTPTVILDDRKYETILRAYNTDRISDFIISLTLFGYYYAENNKHIMAFQCFFKALIASATLMKDKLDTPLLVKDCSLILLIKVIEMSELFKRLPDHEKKETYDAMSTSESIMSLAVNHLSFLSESHYLIDQAFRDRAMFIFLGTMHQVTDEIKENLSEYDAFVSILNNNSNKHKELITLLPAGSFCKRTQRQFIPAILDTDLRCKALDYKTTFEKSDDIGIYDSNLPFLEYLFTCSSGSSIEQRLDAINTDAQYFNSLRPRLMEVFERISAIGTKRYCQSLSISERTEHIQFLLLQIDQNHEMVHRYFSTITQYPDKFLNKELPEHVVKSYFTIVNCITELNKTVSSGNAEAFKGFLPASLIINLSNIVKWYSLIGHYPDALSSNEKKILKLFITEDSSFNLGLIINLLDPIYYEESSKDVVFNAIMLFFMTNCDFFRRELAEKLQAFFVIEAMNYCANESEDCDYQYIKIMLDILNMIDCSDIPSDALKQVVSILMDKFFITIRKQVDIEDQIYEVERVVSDLKGLEFYELVRDYTEKFNDIRENIKEEKKHTDQALDEANKTISKDERLAITDSCDSIISSQGIDLSALHMEDSTQGDMFALPSTDQDSANELSDDEVVSSFQKQSSAYFPDSSNMDNKGAKKSLQTEQVGDNTPKKPETKQSIPSRKYENLAIAENETNQFIDAPDSSDEYFLNLLTKAETDMSKGRYRAVISFIKTHGYFYKDTTPSVELRFLMLRINIIRFYHLNNSFELITRGICNTSFYYCSIFHSDFMNIKFPRISRQRIMLLYKDFIKCKSIMHYRVSTLLKALNDLHNLISNKTDILMTDSENLMAIRKDTDQFLAIKNTLSPCFDNMVISRENLFRLNYLRQGFYYYGLLRSSTTRQSIYQDILLQEQFNRVVQLSLSGTIKTFDSVIEMIGKIRRTIYEVGMAQHRNYMCF